jgi:hypothetical protein
MLQILAKLLPTDFLDDLYDAVFSELIRRGRILLPEDNSSSALETPYDEYRIKLNTEIDNSFTTTWQVYEGDELICEGNNKFHSSVGEAEYSAIRWIKQRQNSRQQCLPS